MGVKSSFIWGLQKELGITERAKSARRSIIPKTWISQREAPNQGRIMSRVGL